MAKDTANVLELAVLGLLSESPMHGYELRKKLSTTLGTFRAFSFGSLYPTLRRLLGENLITEEAPPIDLDAVPLTSRRSRVVYRLTAEGKERLVTLLGDAGPQSWSDDGFGVHLAFFSRTPSAVRMRILEGRRRRVEERREGQRNAVERATDRLDRYTQELQQLGLEATEREVRWLNELIAHEQAGSDPDPPRPGGTSPPPSSESRANKRRP
jgi:DNA-binding PadR family transcriptional regulator